MSTDILVAIVLMFLLFWLPAALILVPFVARQKNRSGFGWALTALFLSPWMALLALAALPQETLAREANADDLEGVPVMDFSRRQAGGGG